MHACAHFLWDGQQGNVERACENCAIAQRSAAVLRTFARDRWPCQDNASPLPPSGHSLYIHSCHAVILCPILPHCRHAPANGVVNRRNELVRELLRSVDVTGLSYLAVHACGGPPVSPPGGAPRDRDGQYAGVAFVVRGWCVWRGCRRLH